MTNHTFTHRDTWYLPVEYAPVAIVLLIIAAIVFLVGVYILTKGSNKYVLVNKLTANALVGHFILAIIVNSSSISLEFFQQSMSEGHCHFYRAVLGLYVIFVNLSFFMYTVERMMYIKNPTAHAQKIGRVGTYLMLVLPWVAPILLGLIFGIAHHFTIKPSVTTEYNIELGNGTNSSVVIQVCHVTFEYMDMGYGITLGILFGFLPFLSCLIIAIVVLSMWCCYKNKLALGTDYAMMGEEVRSTVRDSVIGVSVLNFISCVVQVVSGMPVTIPTNRTHGTGMTTIFGVIQTIVWLGTIKNAREYIGQICGKCCKKKSQLPAVNFETVGQDVNV